MNKISKKKIVTDYLKLFNNYKCILLVKNLGLSALDSRRIRSKLRQTDSKFIVAKNSLVKVALNNTKFLRLISLLNGPLVAVYSNEPISTSKVLVQLCNNNKIKIIGGFFLNKILNNSDVMHLSQMPNQNEIRINLVNLVNIYAKKIANILNSSNAKLTRVIKSYSTK